jgi:hypothetical protein
MRGNQFFTAMVLICLLFLSVLPLSAADNNVKLTWGFSERIRNEYQNNIQDYNKDKLDKIDYFRIRTSLWGQMAYGSNLTLFAQLTNEFRPYLIDNKRFKDFPDKKKRDFTFDEIFFDNLYLKYTTGSTTPVTFTIGRQNLMYGEGFVLMDGGPWDGSRAIYHDAVKVSLKSGTTTIDMLGISNTRVEERLPVLRGKKLSDGELLGQTKDQWMNDGKEAAVGLYMVQKLEKFGQVDAYFIYKQENPNPQININASKDILKLNTLGARIMHPLDAKWTLTTEWAGQIGSQGTYDQKSWGGYGYLTYLLKKEPKAAVTGGCIALSGDDPKTHDNEGWNPLFSRWPKWSELYIYSTLIETINGAKRVAYSTNTLSPYLSYSMTVHKLVSFTANWYHLRAFQSRMIGTEESGKIRGNELQLWVYFKWTPKFTSHILLDYFMPGNFYAEPRSSGMFLRGEIMYRL